MTHRNVKPICEIECRSQLKTDLDAWVEDWTNNSNARYLEELLATTMAWKSGS